MKRFWRAIVGLAMLITVAACGTSGSGSANAQWSSGSSPSASVTPAPPAKPEPAMPTASSGSSKVQEHADNKNGVPVFKGTDGAAPPDNVRNVKHQLLLPHRGR